MASKALIGFNAAVAVGAFLLYLGGVRVVLVNNHGQAQSVVDRVQNLRTGSVPPFVQEAIKETSYRCTHSEMKPKFLSYDPIMVYIENFLSPYETAHLKKLAEAEYEPSVVQNYNNDAKQKKVYVDSSSRKSETAWLRDGDPVVDCVKARSAVFQGFAPNSTMEQLAVLKYAAGGSFETHYDWHYANPRSVDRITSFFATIEASDDIEGGSTWFPMVLQPAWKDKKPWCKWLDCSYQRGLAVRPIPGNALFWVNFRKDGSGHRETAHGGQPVLRGSKIGLNIWTRGKVNGI
ncbi:hypothetical protein diail_4973 [Diaporthe ilicicola]|nr:hypothetical protein diail_4973 [Diaporthe ilicicola]